MELLFNISRWPMVMTIALTLISNGTHPLWLSSPQPSTTHAAQNERSRFEITRDSGGVAHIRAGNENDALFGLGYAHAQDRLWQMEFQRRSGNRRLAEILGDSVLGTDSLFRTVGPHRSAAAAWARFGPRERQPIEAYVAGINAYLNSPAFQLPQEFTILGIVPEPWRAEDVLVWSKVIAWSISSNWDKELLRVQLAAKLGSAKVAQLMPAYTEDGPTILPDAPLVANNKLGGVGKIAKSSTPKVDSSVIDGLLELNRRIGAQTGLGADGYGCCNARALTTEH